MTVRVVQWATGGLGKAAIHTDGVVKEVRVGVGDRIEPDALRVVVEAADTTSSEGSTT